MAAAGANGVFVRRWLVTKQGTHWQVFSPEGECFGGYILFGSAIQMATRLARFDHRHGCHR